MIAGISYDNSEERDNLMGSEMESPLIPIPLQSHKYLYHHRHSWLLKVSY